LLALLPFGHAGAQEQGRYAIPFIKVAASKSAEVVPDLAVMHLGVMTEKKTAAEAANENAKAAQRIVDQVKSLGIESRDIQTVSVTVTPVYDEERDPSGRVTKRTLRGYTARNSLEVRIRQVDKAGAIARQLIDKGANYFGGIQFDIADPEQRLGELRIAALQDAARKARSYADALGVKLGRILEIAPQPQAEGPIPARALRSAAEAAPAVIPVEPGVKTLEAHVTVVWALME
jgi:uncharacterized protein YggE